MKEDLQNHFRKWQEDGISMLEAMRTFCGRLMVMHLSLYHFKNGNIKCMFWSPTADAGIWHSTPSPQGSQGRNTLSASAFLCMSIYAVSQFNFLFIQCCTIPFHFIGVKPYVKITVNISDSVSQETLSAIVVIVICERKKRENSGIYPPAFNNWNPISGFKWF